VNVAVAVFDPAGKPLFALDNNSIGEAEDVELIAATSGKYRLRVTASEAQSPAGRYEITLAAVSHETDRHKTRIAAARQVALATTANRRGTREAMQQAIRYFDAARFHWHAAEDPSGAGFSINGPGRPVTRVGNLGSSQATIQLARLGS
jgi:hypothetical protein